MFDKVGMYIRVSSDKQVLEGHSLEWQEHILMEYAKANNMNVVDKYIEKGISGEKIETRPQLLRLLKDIKNKKITSVLVYKVDRLGRKEATNVIIGKTLIESNCTLITSDTGVLDLETAYGSFLFNILSAISQYEVNLLSERVINGKKQRVRKGLYINSYNVYGYDNQRIDDEKGLLKINDFESKIVNEIFNSYLNGKSMNDIAQNLNYRKIPTKRKGIWRQSTIRQILSNKLYIGIVVYNGIKKKEHFENKGIHKPIIDKELFNKVQVLINDKNKNRIKKAPSEFTYFASILKTFDNYLFKSKYTKGKDPSSIRYYTKDKNANIPSIKHIKLEELFAKSLSNIKLKKDEEIIKSLFKNDDYDILIDILNKLKKDEDKLFEWYSIESIEDEIFKERLNKINIKIKETKKKKEELEKRMIKYSDVENKINKILNNSLEDNFNMLNAKDKKNFVNLFVDSVKINKNHNISVIWKKAMC